MARITIEDCAEKIQDRFKLVILAAQRAKDINSGSVMTINNINDKATVVALREIAAGHISILVLTEQLIRRLQTTNPIESIDDKNLDHILDDNTAKNFDYILGGTELCITDDYSDLDDQIFNETNIDNETKIIPHNITKYKS